jgi:hypothetical protein
MLISKVIEKLQEIMEKHGDCELMIDCPELMVFVSDFDIEDKYYTYNYHIDGKPAEVAFIIVPPED